MTDASLKSINSNPFKSSKKLGLKFRLTLFGIRGGFKLFGCMVPSIAERMALKLFLTPPRHNIPDWQKPYILTAKKFELSVGKNLIKVYKWGEGPAILLVHGWGGRGSQLSAFINPLVNSGYSVFTFDGPAHGESTGKQCDMFEFSSVINAVANSIQSLHAIIAHSFGSACSLLALREHKIKIDKLVLIGCPESAIWVSENFAERLSISKKIIVGMRKILEHRYNNKWTWDDLSLSKMVKKIIIPILIIHDRKDLEVPYQQALEIQKAANTSELMTTEGQGHRRILRAEEVINKVVSFLNTNNKYTT